MDEKQKRKDKKIDQAGNMSFPASDATAHGKATSTERPGRPIAMLPTSLRSKST